MEVIYAGIRVLDGFGEVILAGRNFGNFLVWEEGGEQIPDAEGDEREKEAFLAGEVRLIQVELVDSSVVNGWG